MFAWGSLFFCFLGFQIHKASMTKTRQWLLRWLTWLAESAQLSLRYKERLPHEETATDGSCSKYG